MNASEKLIEEARIHASESPSKDIRFFAESVISTVEQLRAEIAHLSLYKPARRTEQTPEPVKRIGPTNFAFYGIVETDEEFAERAGTEVEE